MCLTEPGAGPDVGALKTSAKKNADGSYWMNQRERASYLPAIMI